MRRPANAAYPAMYKLVRWDDPASTPIADLEKGKALRNKTMELMDEWRQLRQLKKGHFDGVRCSLLR